MTKSLSLAITVFFLPFLCGCGANNSKQEAESAINKYFAAISQQDLDKAVELYSNEFFTVIPKDKWRNLLSTFTSKLGKHISHNQIDWKYTSKVGTDGSSQITVLIYKVRYENGEATETFSFLGNGESGQWKITGHQINSPLLLETDKKTP
jgi:hypothetical protein